MMSPLPVEKIKKIFGLEFINSSKLSQFGGSSVFLTFLSKSRIRQRLKATVGDRAAHALVQIMVGVFAGADSMEAVVRVCNDRIFKDWLGFVYSETQLTRILRELRPSQVQQLHELSLSLAFLDVAGEAYKGDPLVIDVDATHKEMAGNQEGVEVGYLEEDKLGKCYQYLFFRNDFLDTIMYGTIRGGAAHSQNGFCGYLQMMLPMFGGQRSLSIRADAGYFNEQAFDICHNNNACFFIKAPMIPTRQALARSPGLQWKKQNEKDLVEWATYDTCTSAGTPWREVFKRTFIPRRPGEMFDSYEYQCVATNHGRKEPWAVFEFYNRRARIEKTIDEFKDDYNLGSIVTQWFHVNDAITQATIILYQLVAHFKRHLMDKADKKMRLATLRTLYFAVPARFVETARRATIRIQNVFRNGMTYGRILARLLNLKTLLVIVPIPDSC